MRIKLCTLKYKKQKLCYIMAQKKGKDMNEEIKNELKKNESENDLLKNQNTDLHPIEEEDLNTVAGGILGTDITNLEKSLYWEF